MGEVILGDALEVLRGLRAGSVDALVTDPPAGISFMDRGWDSDRGGRERWVAWLSGILAEARRVVKPGGYALVWALPRRSHWTGFALEEAGWVVVDSIHHVFGTGFPSGETTLKPAHECWWLARAGSRYPEPLRVDACRVEYLGDADKLAALRNPVHKRRDVSDRWGWGREWMEDQVRVARLNAEARVRADRGRYPPNFLLSHDPGCTDGNCVSGCPVEGVAEKARYFPTFRYVPKVWRDDRVGHPTQKSLELMRWLVKLVARPGGVVLDCFLGSGTTAVAAVLEGVDFIGVDDDPESVSIARARLEVDHGPSLR